MFIKVDTRKLFVPSTRFLVPRISHILHQWFVFLSSITSIILVNNVRSKSLWFVNPLGGEIIGSWFLNQHIFDHRGFNFWYNCSQSLGQFSFSKSASGHSCLPPRSIRMNSRTQFLYSWLKLSFALAILHGKSTHLLNCWNNKNRNITLFLIYSNIHNVSHQNKEKHWSCFFHFWFTSDTLESGFFHLFNKRQQVCLFVLQKNVLLK